MQCESCGHDSDDLAAVQRIYLLEADAEGVSDGVGPDKGTTVVDDIELWCFPCRSHYPHRRVVEGGVGDDDA